MFNIDILVFVYGLGGLEIPGPLYATWAASAWI